ncbi:uncharacterized protein BDW47DRAFT_106547 [Aspergillus candidus]|uniref:Uncharacterized protein n=1 Tax=Aspergillus candidus TaxID=41067 RepID=A0A2I2FAH3_ASPCN|nr:hypothetical protein BDW47DRAFT_106547 [Aspergillus candidus]PLB37627.1 hypothetical protein BDW47DRAFT_106547 [Aspergillus candidus]
MTPFHMYLELMSNFCPSTVSATPPAICSLSPVAVMMMSASSVSLELRVIPFLVTVLMVSVQMLALSLRRLSKKSPFGQTHSRWSQGS